MKRDAYTKSWRQLQRQELFFLTSHRKPGAAPLQKLEQAVPEKLRSTLSLAFEKAFSAVFTHGSGWIDKTYPKAAHLSAQLQNRATIEERSGRAALRPFEKSANRSTRGNLLLTSLEGVGLGALGVGLPDIPLFTAVLLKSIYEIAAHYGFPVDTPTERTFVLQLIAAALQDGAELRVADTRLNEWIAHPASAQPLQPLLETAAQTLADRLLYSKFLQGIPVAGAVGGLENTVVLGRVTAYAQLKYRRRILLECPHD